MITERLSDLSTADLMHKSIDIRVLMYTKNKISQPSDQCCT